MTISAMLAAYWCSHWKWAVRGALAASALAAILVWHDHRERNSPDVVVQSIRGSQP